MIGERRKQDLARQLLLRLEGGAPPNVALMHLLMQAHSPADVDAGLSEARAVLGGGPPTGPKLDAVESLWRQGPGAWDIVHGIAGSFAHGPSTRTPEQALRYWREAFDRLAASSPEAGVALYALGRADLLEAATAEVADRLDEWGLLGADRDVLDLGCGIGRFCAALSPRVRSVLGLDLSAGMLAEARRRCHALANVRLLVSSGRDLAAAGDAAFDLLLAADVFPYLVEAGGGALEIHFREAARVLRPGGSLVILNLSYRGDEQRDRDDVERLAGAAGFGVLRPGTRDFQLWDAATFHLVKG